MPHSILIQFLLILCSTLLLAIAILLLSFYKRLFIGVSNFWLRQNLSVLSVAVVFMAAFLSLQSPEMITNAGKKGLLGIILKQLGHIVIIVLFVFNTVWLISRTPIVKAMSFIKYHAVIIVSIVVSAIIIYSVINYVDNGMKFKNLHSALLYAYFNSVVTGLVYTAVHYVDLERKRKLNEKELEVSRLQGLKQRLS